MNKTTLFSSCIAVAMVTILTTSIQAAGPGGHGGGARGAVRPGGRIDHREDVRDRRENVLDRREDIRDVKNGNNGPLDRREDIRDRREDVRDHREDRWENHREAFRKMTPEQRQAFLKAHPEFVENAKERREEFLDNHPKIQDRLDNQKK